MSTSNHYTLEQNDSYARIDWKSSELVQSNYEELELAIRFLFKKEYANIILNTAQVQELDGYGVSAIRKGTKICTNELGLFAVVTKNEDIQDRLDQAKIENLNLLNTVQEAIDAIYLNDLENDFEDGGEEDEEYGSEFTDTGEDY
jgi:hypothetical protein